MAWGSVAFTALQSAWTEVYIFRENNQKNSLRKFQLKHHPGQVTTFPLIVLADMRVFICVCVWFWFFWAFWISGYHLLVFLSSFIFSNFPVFLLNLFLLIHSFISLCIPSTVCSYVAAFLPSSSAVQNYFVLNSSNQPWQKLGPCRGQIMLLI